MNKEMNVMIAINKEYLEICKTMIFSLFKYNPNKKICIYMLNKSLEESDIKDFSMYVEDMGGRFISINVSKEDLPNLPLVLDRFSIEMYYRIIAYKLLPNTLERILWLDSDIIINGSLDKFYNQNFNNKYLVVCKDFYESEKAIQNIKHKMDIHDEHKYFNSGVILFNLSKIRENINDDMIYGCIEEYKDKLTYPDQDILNNLFQNKVKYADERVYNFQVNNIYDLKETEKESIVILHYSGCRKPWDSRRAFPICKFYWNIELERKRYKQVILFKTMYIILFLPKKIKNILKGNI